MLSREYLDLLDNYGAPQYRLTVNSSGRRTIARHGTPFFTLTEPMWDYSLRIRDMDSAGVDLAIVSLTCPNAYFGGPGVSLKAAQSVNDAMAQWAALAPDRIRWLASLPWQYPDLALAELDRAVAAGAVGVMVIATIDGRPLTERAFAGIWAEIDRRALPVLVHPGPPTGAAALGLDEFGLAPAVGFPFDTTLAFARLFFDGFLDRYPNLRLIAAHGGGALPYLAGRLDRCHAEIPAAAAVTPTPPSEYMRRIWYDAVVYTPQALGLCIDAAGSDERVLFGSDYPHNLGDMAGCRQRVEALPDAAARRVRGANARELFNL